MSFAYRSEFRVFPVVEPRFQQMCRFPYSGHPKGCPNFGKKIGCPPQPLLEKVIDLSSEVWMIINRFDIGSHAARMRKLHPAWTDAQAYCCLYWQPRARAELGRKVDRFLHYHPGFSIVYCPEAYGVNVTATAASVGVNLEWPPKHEACQIVLAGILLEM